MTGLFEDFIFVRVGSAANSVGTTHEFAAFRSGPDAKYSRASAFWFFLSTTMVFAAVRTHLLRKKRQHCNVDRHLVKGKEISSKLTSSSTICVGGLVESCLPACHVCEWGSILSGDMNF